MKTDFPGSKISKLSDLLPESYRDAFQDYESPFIYYYRLTGEKHETPLCITRGQFLEMSLKAAGMIIRRGLRPGDRFLNGFASNNPADLAFRLAAMMTGTTPATLNWQADSGERAAYKAFITEAKMLLFEKHLSSEIIDAVTQRCPGIKLFDIDHLDSEPFPESPLDRVLHENGDEKIIIFTSGTTGDPKGVVLTLGNYDTNAATFRQMFAPIRKEPLHLIMVNPMHHANSTAMSDWFLREKDAVIHMLPRYTTPYWSILAEVADKTQGMVIAPGVSRHFDFLEELVERGTLPIGKRRLSKALSKVSFLLGSAPVGPTTVERLRRWTGHLPFVRFGSTETCLQALGTPTYQNEQDVLEAFESGWDRKPSPGYYIGRPHPPHTDAMVVESVTPGSKEYMRPSRSGEEGFLVARGGNIMREYLGKPQVNDEVFHNGWYLGFGDICFFLVNPSDGENDYYWLGRDSALLIRGGANYSCDQIATELTLFTQEHYSLAEGDFDLAVVGIRLESEHEDTCCVMIDASSIPTKIKKDMKASFLEEAGRAVSKGAKPQRLRFGPIPRNFKGGINIRELKKAWMEQSR